MNIYQLQRNLDKAKEEISKIKGNVCIVSINYKSKGLVEAIIELKNDNSTIKDILNIKNISILKNIQNKVFNILIKV